MPNQTKPQPPNQQNGLLQFIEQFIAYVPGLTSFKNFAMNTGTTIYNLPTSQKLALAGTLGAITYKMPWVYFAAFYKWQVWSLASIFMFLSRDGRKRKIPDAGKLMKTEREVASKTIIFVRHGESAWNEVFNKGKDLSMLYRLLKAIFMEVMMFLKQDSWFIDSPLNRTGISQAQKLMMFLEGTNRNLDEKIMTLIPILRGEAGKSLLVVSNLRRAISTMLVGFGSRLLRDQTENVVVLSNLQEISRNVDTYSLLPAHADPQPCFTEEQQKEELDYVIDFYKRDRFIVKDNKGSKTIFGQCGTDRICDFARWCFDGSETIGKETIIVAGHSLYFRNFFRTFLPEDSDHVAKNSKLVNCGVVKFELVKGNNNGYWIRDGSLMEVYGGFEASKKKQ